MYLENFEIHDVKVDDEALKKGLNLYEEVENKLLNRFFEAEKAFGFETKKEIDIWDFLSISRNPQKLRNLQKLITTFKDEKVRIKINKQIKNIDWLDELEVNNLNEIDKDSDPEEIYQNKNISREYFILDI
jgi:hypothetical protein